MRAPKLIQHMKCNADSLSGAVFQKIRKSEKCRELCLRVPDQEQKRSIAEIYFDLTDWLATDASSSIEERYVALGIRRSEQEVPFTDVFWAVCIAHEHLWEYMQQECLVEEPVEFWGGVMLLRSLTQFFDRTLYFVLSGYQKAAKGELAAAALDQGT